MSAAVQAQQSDPIIMTVAGIDVPRSEFEYSYNKNNTDGVIDKKTVDEYVELFVNYKLKVKAALDARLDTTTSFRQEFAQYRDQQIRPVLVTDDDMLAEAHRIYDQTNENIGPDGLVNASHILLRIAQKASDAEQQEAKRRIDSVYTALQAGADFEALAKQVSQDPGSGRRGGALGWFARNQMVKEFEDAAFALQPGEMSKPFLSPYGWHIVLVKERKQFEPFEFHKDNIFPLNSIRTISSVLWNSRICVTASQSVSWMRRWQPPAILLPRSSCWTSVQTRSLLSILRCVT